MVRIVDVAALAGVSTATVSRVLNGKPVREDLTAAVQRAVQELQYSPNRAARTLRRRSAEVIVLILSDIENPFFTSLARGVEDMAHRHGYSVVLCNSDDDLDKEKRYLRIAVTDSMAGGVIICPADEASSLSEVLGSPRSAVVVDREVTADVDHVLLDNADVTRRALRPLIQAGCQQIACATGPASIATAHERGEVWREEMERAGLQAPDELLIHSSFKVDGGRTAAEQLLSLASPPDAILATNNLVGVGVLQVLSERAISLDDVRVSVVGDLPFATSSTADVPIVRLHPREMGLAAAELLIQRMTGKLTGPGNRVVLGPDGESGQARELSADVPEEDPTEAVPTATEPA